jgi:hypothetical protein
MGEPAHKLYCVFSSAWVTALGTNRFMGPHPKGARNGIGGTAVLRGSMGFSQSRRLRSAKILRLSFRFAHTRGDRRYGAKDSVNGLVTLKR